MHTRILTPMIPSLIVAPMYLYKPQPSRDENVRALIGYVCSAPLDSETDDSALISGNRAVDKDYPTRKSAADAGPETSLKRFGLKILRAIIETAPAVGDGSESLSGVWQAGDSKRNGDGANEVRREKGKSTG